MTSCLDCSNFYVSILDESKMIATVRIVVLNVIKEFYEK